MADDDKVFRISGRVEIELKVESPPGESVGGKPRLPAPWSTLSAPPPRSCSSC